MSFISKINKISNHCVDRAVILDKDFNVSGKIYVRYTPSKIGCNHEVGVLLPFCGLDLSLTIKGKTFIVASFLTILGSGSVQCFSKRLKITESNARSFNTKDVKYLEVSGEAFTVLWV